MNELEIKDCEVLPEERTPTFRARLMIGFGFLAVVCFVVVGIGEVILRVFVLYQAPPNPLRPMRPDLYQADEKVGYRLWPSTNTFDRYPVNSPEITPIVSNSDGFRSRREFDEPDPRM